MRALTPGVCGRDKNMCAQEEGREPSNPSAGILGEGGIVLDVMWVEVGGKRH